MTDKKKNHSTKKKTPPKENESVLTKEDFFRLLDKAIQPKVNQPVSPQKKRPAKEKSKTSE